MSVQTNRNCFFHILHLGIVSLQYALKLSVFVKTGMQRKKRSVYKTLGSLSKWQPLTRPTVNKFSINALDCSLVAPALSNGIVTYPKITQIVNTLPLALKNNRTVLQAVEIHNCKSSYANLLNRLCGFYFQHLLHASIRTYKMFLSCLVALLGIAVGTDDQVLVWQAGREADQSRHIHAV